MVFLFMSLSLSLSSVYIYIYDTCDWTPNRVSIQSVWCNLCCACRAYAVTCNVDRWLARATRQQSYFGDEKCWNPKLITIENK